MVFEKNSKADNIRRSSAKMEPAKKHQISHSSSFPYENGTMRYASRSRVAIWGDGTLGFRDRWGKSREAFKKMPFLSVHGRALNLLPQTTLSDPRVAMEIRTPLNIAYRLMEQEEKEF